MGRKSQTIFTTKDIPEPFGESPKLGSFGIIGSELTDSRDILTLQYAVGTIMCEMDERNAEIDSQVPAAAIHQMLDNTKLFLKTTANI